MHTEMPKIVRAHRTASWYGDDGSRNADGSGYGTWHCASKDYPIGSVLGVYRRVKTKHGHRLEKVFEIPNRDVCGISGRVDFTRSAYRVLASRCGVRDGFRRGLIPIEVRLLHGPRKGRHGRKR